MPLGPLKRERCEQQHRRTKTSKTKSGYSNPGKSTYKPMKKGEY